MSVKLFNGFDHSNNNSNAFFSVASLSTFNAWARWIRGQYMFHNKGVATLDRTISAPQYPASTTIGGMIGSAPTALGGPAAGRMYWPGKSASDTSATLYTGATTTTRATAVTAQGFQLGLVRDLVLPAALSADEYWFSFDCMMPEFPASSLSASHTPAFDWQSIFRWGDVEIKFKSSTYVSGSATSAIHDVVFSVRNNGTEVATITVPGVLCYQNGLNASALWFLIRVKLNDTTGLIEASCSGNAQSVAYTGQNTVNTISNAAATAFYIGPVITDDGTNMRYGGLDNILVDDAEFPAGRPTVRIVTLLADDTLTDVAAAGTSPTTVVNALSNHLDAKHLRFLSASGRALMTNTMPSTVGLSTVVLGFQGGFISGSNRYPLASRRIAVGVSLSAVDSEDEYAKTITLPFSSIMTPPETLSSHSDFFIAEKGGGGKFATSDLSSVKTYIRSVS